MTQELIAIVLCKNAEQTLRACLTSLQFCSEIIIADDGSTDHTLSIAKCFHAKIIRLPQLESFADKRNEAMKYAKNGWILFIDSDETVATDHWPEINGKDAYRLQRVDYFLGKKLEYGETGDQWLTRLVKKGTGRWVRAVHEVWQSEGEVGKLDVKLSHTSHPTIESFLDKINAYSELESGLRVKNKNLHYLLLSTYLQLGIYPVTKFIQNYIFKLGFLDGFPGFVLAYMMSLHSLCVRIKTIEKLRL